MGNVLENRRRRKVENTMIDLRLQKSRFQRDSAHAEKIYRTQKEKMKAALLKGDPETAKVHAEAAIREKNHAVSMQKMANRFELLADKLKEAMAAQQLQKTLGIAVKGLDVALKSLTPENLATKMGDFEKVSEDLGAVIDFTDVVIGDATKAPGSDDAVSNLMQEVAEENGMELAAILQQDELVPSGPVVTPAPKVKTGQEAQTLEA